jgi:hypothetical protein
LSKQSSFANGSLEEGFNSLIDAGSGFLLLELQTRQLADKLSASGWSWGCISAVDSEGRTLWIVDAHRDTSRRFVVRSDEKLTAFLELERITHELALSALLGDDVH